MGCLRSIGCLTVLVLVAAGAYVTRGYWVPRLMPAKPAVEWAPMTASGAAATRRALDRLAAPKGPPYVEVTGAEFASYLVPDPQSWAQAAVIDDKLHIRLQSEPIETAGTIDVPRPGVGVFRATDITVGGVPLPRAIIFRMYHRPDSVAVSVPTAVGDIRVARGHITLYKKIP